MTNACTQAQLAQFVNACVVPGATTTSCNDWQADAGGTCIGCLFTEQSASAWGPVICNGGCSLNYGGCLDLELNQVSLEKQNAGAGSCGDELSADFLCQDYACLACNLGSPDYETCTASAVANQCKSYVDQAYAASACAVLFGDAAPPSAAKCTPMPNATDDLAFVNVFCGSGP